jgi:hypothetical protein
VDQSQCDRILETLALGKGGHDWSTYQLMDASGSLAVHSRIAELRARGHEIEHRRVARWRDGRRRMVSAYRLVQKAAA